MKILYLIRGLPGTGKTTLAARLAGYRVAADDYFTDSDGNYNFNPAHLGVAHEQCQLKIKGWMKSSLGGMAVHNTFSQQWEAQPYIDMAKEHGYTVVIIECQTILGNTHDVPEESIQAMRDRWEPINV